MSKERAAVMVKEAVSEYVFSWQHAKVKSTKINPPLLGTRLHLDLGQLLNN